MINSVNNVFEHSLFSIRELGVRLKRKSLNKMDEGLIRYDAWFIVLVVILAALAFTIASALAIWCVTNQHGHFTGEWNWSLKHVSVSAACSKK